MPARGWLLLVPALLAGCHRPGQLSGRLALAPGEQGDAGGCLVELLVYEDTSFVLVKSAVSDPPDRFGRSRYEIRDLVEGARFLRAWKDLDADSAVSDGDLVGVLRGRYRRGYGGEPFWLFDDKWNEAELIEMARFDEVELDVSGRRLPGDSITEFRYAFSHDVDLTTLEITFPLLGSYLDAGGPGRKLADTVYLSTGWRLVTGPMPAGEHLLRFRGTGLDTLFDTTLSIQVY